MMMNANYKDFYRHFYLKTGGFIPAKPLSQHIYPGDFFQIQNGEMVVLGNIFRNQIIDPEFCKFEYGAKLNPMAWKFQEGVTKPYTGNENGYGPLDGEIEYSKQIISFATKGSFIFKGNEPESVKILNWGDIQQQLIIKLTQTYYSFREVYLVTESVATADWTLAIANDQKAELELITDHEGPGLIDVFGHHNSKTILAKDLEYYHREPNRKPSFFKAKKLVVQDEQLDVFISELLINRENQNEWAKGFYNYNFHYDDHYAPQVYNGTRTNVLDMLKGNELNPNTALLYFRWADASLDDIEKFFVGYGE